MRVVECNSENCNWLIDFAKEMLNTWSDKSSMSKKNTCCPERTGNELLKKIKDTENYKFYYAVNDNKVVGFLCAEENIEKGSVYISYINVHPEYRRQNILKKMLEYVQSIAIEKEFSFLKLNTWTENDTALRVFEKLGFIVEQSCSCTVNLYKPL